MESSPFPFPDFLDGYNRAVPGGGDRLLSLTEREAAHRHEMEKIEAANRHERQMAEIRKNETVDLKEVENDRIDAMADAHVRKVGAYGAPFMGGCAYVVSGVLGYTGHDNVAIAIAGTVSAIYGGAYLVGIFARAQQASSKKNKKDDQ